MPFPRRAAEADVLHHFLEDALLSRRRIDARSLGFEGGDDLIDVVIR